MSRTLLCCAVLFLFGAVCADVTVTYDAASYTHYTWLPSDSSKKVLISYGGLGSGGQTNVQYLYCKPAEGETITLRGDPLKFADGRNSYIVMQGWGTLVIENSVTKYLSTYSLIAKPNSLPAVPTNTYSGALIAASGVGARVFENLKLEDYDPVASTQSAAALPAAAEMQVVRLHRGYDDEGRLFKQFQFQCGANEVSGSYSYVYRIVKVRLTQVGDDVHARVVSAFDVRCGLNGSGQPSLDPGFDVDDYRVGLQSYVAESVACRTAESAEGYGVDGLTLVRTKLPTVRFAGAVSVTSGSDYVEAQGGVRVEYANRSWLRSGTGTKYTGTLRADDVSETAIAGIPVGTSLAAYPENYVSGRLLDTGTFTLLGEDPVYTYVSTDPQPITTSADPYAVVLRTTNDEATVVSGASAQLSCVTTNNVKFFTKNSERVSAAMYHLREVTDESQKAGKGDKRYRMQFQAEVPARTGTDVYVLCAYLDVEINSTTGEVFVGPPRFPTTEGGTDYRGSVFSILKDEEQGRVKGMDFDTVMYGKGATHYWDSSSFKITSGLNLTFSSAKTGESTLYFSWTDQLYRRTSGTVCVRGTTNHYPVYSSYGGGLLTNQVFEIGPYGALSIAQSPYPDKYRTFNVYQGGEIRMNSGVSMTNATTYAVGASATVIGGRLRSGVGRSSDAYDAGGYGFQHVMLKDGADIVGFPMRVGNQSLYPDVCVAGESPSKISAGYVIAGTGQKGTVCTSASFTFAVADVTGDEEADLIVNGPIKHYATSSWTPGTVPVHKKGGGTVLFNVATVLNDNYPVTLDAGTWKFGSNDVAQATLPIKLNGGTLAAASATTNSAGPLILTADSAIALDADAELVIADSSEQEWTAGKILSVTIPTNAAGDLQATLKFVGATSSQVRKIRLNGERAMLNEEGEVVPRPNGLSIIVL